MMCHLIRWSVLGFSSLTIIAMVGCARSITVVPSPIDRQEATAQSVANEDRVPFIMDTFRLSLNGAPPIMIDELKGHVTEACLHDLMHQLVQDADLYLASSTALSASTIRTVTVKATKPAAATAAFPTAPVSANPAP